MSHYTPAPPAYGVHEGYSDESDDVVKSGLPSYQGGGYGGKRGQPGDDGNYSSDSRTNYGSRFNFDTSEYRDFPCLVAFLIQLVVFGAASFITGREFANEGGFTRLYDEASITPYSIALFVLIIAISSALLSFAYLNFMHKHIDDVMRLSFYTFLVFLAATGLISVYFAKSAGVAILSAICFALSLFYYYSIRDRLELAGAILRSASLSLVAHPGPIYIAFSCMVLQLAWILAWCLGAVFILSSLGMLDITTMDTDIRGPKTVTVSHSLAVAGLLVSLYWTSQVIKNISHVTTAGTVASWWLVPSRVGDTCFNSLKRACSYSLGSICFGSLVVALLQTLQALLRFFVKEDERNFVQYCLDCILGCIERALQFFNHFAYTYVAIYGDAFIPASQKAWSLFYHRGFFVIIHNDLTHLPLFLGKVLISLVLSMLTYFYVSVIASLPSSHCIAFSLSALLIGVLITSVVFGVVTSAVSCTLVLWAESPMEMSQTQPVAYNSIADAGKHECGYDDHDNEA